MPTIAQLEYVLAVQRTGHFGRAADECGVAQPTLSAQIQKVEQELGVVLFDRTRKPVSVTAHAAQLLSHARDVVAAHDRLLGAAKEEEGSISGEFDLGIIPTLAPYVLPWFLREFSEAHPRLSVRLSERPTDALIDEILGQRLDAAILATPLEIDAIREKTIFYDPFYLYAHADEPLLSETEVQQDRLLAEKVWLLEDGHCVRTQVSNFCGLPGTNVHLTNVYFSAGSFDTLRNLIDAAGGYTLFPETYVRQLPRQARRGQVRPVARTPTREISLVHARSNWKTHAIDALAAHINAGLPRSLRRNSADGEILSIR